MGLKPVYRRVWAPRGKTPLASVRPRYRWLYVYGFVRPGTGESEFWLLPTVNAVAFSEVLGRFARLRGAGEGKLLLLVLDRAGWHVSGRVEVPGGWVWSSCPLLSRAPTRGAGMALGGRGGGQRAGGDGGGALGEGGGPVRLFDLQTQPGLIRSHTLFRWWPGGC
ncbi:hypothetical protein TthSNM66_19060 [Thermus thermophilus]|nr:hypothetical protein TthSNM66_19060 [Thermus thermophilus]BDG29592.1 hypothetical protein TthSNM76_18020 [Thermus thermophilus]